MMKYCKSLKFEDDPNYDYLQQLLKDVFVRNGYDYDFNFDWRNEIPAPGKKLPVLWGDEARKLISSSAAGAGVGAVRPKTPEDT